jgi:copper chaperone CopZ
MITRATVQGMTCQHCVSAVFTALAAVEGIERANVKIGAIEVEHVAWVTLDQIRDAVRVAGYEVVDGAVERRALRVL